MTKSPEQLIQGVLGEAWEAFKKDAVLHIVAMLIVAVVGTITLGILAPALTIGYIRLIRDRLEGKAVESTAVFAGLSDLVPSLILGVVIAVLVSIGFVLLVIPGLVLSLLFAFAFHAMALDNAGIGDSISKSINLVKGNLVGVLILLVVFGILNTVGGFVVIGFLVTAPLTAIAMNLAYQQLKQA